MKSLDMELLNRARIDLESELKAIDATIRELKKIERRRNLLLAFCVQIKCLLRCE